MSVKRRDLIRYFEKNGLYLPREGGKHSIYTNDKKLSLSKGINNSIELQQASFVSMPG